LICRGEERNGEESGGSVMGGSMKIINIYLDLNVMIDYFQNSNEELSKIINNQLTDPAVRFPYSPAHIEETFNIYRSFPDFEESFSLSDSLVFKELSNISKLSNNIEYLPCKDNGIIMIWEFPFCCFQRVLEEYELTHFAEKCAEITRSSGCSLKYEIHNINDVDGSELFKRRDVCEYLSNFLDIFTDRGNDIISKGMNYQQIVERTIPLLFDFLDAIKYKSGKDSQVRSNMHDVTHCKYATKADIFVTNDRKLFHRTKAIYSLINEKTNIKINTRVFMENEFIDIFED
jgi:hypothetical protein